MKDIFVQIFRETDLSSTLLGKGTRQPLFDLTPKFEGYFLFFLLLVLVSPVLIYLIFLIYYYCNDKYMGYLIPFVERENLAEENYVDLPVLEKAENAEDDIVKKVAESIDMDPEKLRSYIESEEVSKTKYSSENNKTSKDSSLNKDVEKWLAAKEVISNFYEQTHEKIEEEKENEKLDKAIKITLSDGEKLSRISFKLSKLFEDIKDK